MDRLRSAAVAALLAACGTPDDSAGPSCGPACADYYTVRALDSVHTSLWANVLSREPAVGNVVTYKAVEVPCAEGSMTANGTATVETDASVSLDLVIDHAGCKQADPAEGGGFDITMTGSVAWNGSFADSGAERSFSYQASELGIEGDVYELGVPTSVDETCPLQASLVATSAQEFSFSGTWCSREIADPGT